MDTMQLAHPRQKACGVPIALLLTAFLSGCGGGGVCPIEGRVIWKDGAPAKELAGSHVVFDLPEKQTSARGIIQTDGSFRLTTKKPDDGALAGEHTVLIVEVGRKPLGGADSSTLAPGAIDARYSDPTTSNLRATVQPGGSKITLTVERAARR